MKTVATSLLVMTIAACSIPITGPAAGDVGLSRVEQTILVSGQTKLNCAVVMPAVNKRIELFQGNWPTALASAHSDGKGTFSIRAQERAAPVTIEQSEYGLPTLYLRVDKVEVPLRRDSSNVYRSEVLLPCPSAN